MDRADRVFGLISFSRSAGAGVSDATAQATITLDQGERVVRARIAGVPVTKIAKDEGRSIAAVNAHIDSWVSGNGWPGTAASGVLAAAREK